FTLWFAGCSADAGTDQRVSSGAKVTLSASLSSTSHGGDMVRYEWEQLSPLSPRIIPVDTKKLGKKFTFVTPSVKAETKFRFRLTTVEHYDCTYSATLKGPSCKSDLSTDKINVFVSAKRTDTNTTNDTNETNLTDNNTTETNTTALHIVGKITDFDNLPIEQATVTIGRKTVETNSTGTYDIEMNATSKKVVIQVQHADYFNNSRILTSFEKNTTVNMKIEKPIKTVSFSSNLGAYIKQYTSGLTRYASINLPASGYTLRSTNDTYVGTINAKMSYHPFSSRKGKLLMPGIENGREYNSTNTINSYGYMRIELVDEEGNVLDLASNKEATLIFPVDTNISKRPNNITLSYFNEATDTWIPNTNATLTKENNTSTVYVYKGTISALKSWSLDLYTDKTFHLNIISDTNESNSNGDNNYSNGDNNNSNNNNNYGTGGTTSGNGDTNNSNTENNETEDNSTTNINNTTKYKISGTITNTQNKPVLGAVISTKSEYTSTDSNGSYSLENVSSTSKIMLNVNHSNYFDNSRILHSLTKDATLKAIKIKKISPHAFLALNEKVITDGSASVYFPSNAYNTSKGKDYLFSVTASIDYHRFNTPLGKALMPGLTEENTENIRAYSYINLKVIDNKNNPLKLKARSTITLTFPVEATFLSTPATLPLSYYNVKKGKWMKEGEATLSTDKTKYTAKVKRISSWGLNVIIP
ncbi:MAG: hypothetical protein DSZ09_02790, partial [Sulfurovum sp.]